MATAMAGNQHPATITGWSVTNTASMIASAPTAPT
jgi:hypothetical protein